MAEGKASVPGHHRRVAIRFGLKVGVFVVLSAANAAAGLPNPFVALLGLSALLCVGLALANREVPLDRSLDHWDEASWFMLITCLA